MNEKKSTVINYENGFRTNNQLMRAQFHEMPISIDRVLSFNITNFGFPFTLVHIIIVVGVVELEYSELLDTLMYAFELLCQTYQSGMVGNCFKSM